MGTCGVFMTTSKQCHWRISGRQLYLEEKAIPNFQNWAYVQILITIWWGQLNNRLPGNRKHNQSNDLENTTVITFPGPPYICPAFSNSQNIEICPFILLSLPDTPPTSWRPYHTSAQWWNQELVEFLRTIQSAKIRIWNHWAAIQCWGMLHSNSPGLWKPRWGGGHLNKAVTRDAESKANAFPSLTGGTGLGFRLPW